MNKHTLIGLFSSVALLSGCGGGGSYSAPAAAPAVTDAVSDAASTSAMGLTTYLSDLTKKQVEDKEPVDLSKFTPMQPENTEPDPVQ